MHRLVEYLFTHLLERRNVGYPDAAVVGADDEVVLTR
jgi:hypothetical protein